LVDYLAKQDTAKDWAGVFNSLFDAEHRQPIDIDSNPLETKHILWLTNNRYTELGLRNYMHKTNMMFNALRLDNSQLEKNNEALHLDIEKLEGELVESANELTETKQYYETSISYRIGLAITYLPRKIKGMLSR
jgi:hypothetical protein